MSGNLPGRKRGGHDVMKGRPLESVLAACLTANSESLQVVVIDTKGQYRYFSPSHAEFVKQMWNVEVAAGMPILQAVKEPLFEDEFKEYFGKAINGQECSFGLFISTQTDNFCSRYHLCPIRDEGGLVTDVAIMISQREGALCQINERLAVTLNAIGDAVISTDVKGRIVGMNPAAEKLVGLTEHQSRGRHVDELLNVVACDDRSTKLSLISQAIAGRVVVEGVGNKILQLPGGTEHVIAESVAPIFSRDGKIVGTVLVIRDATLAKMAEERLLQSQKMEAIGRLAGGIAHDFNNQLTVISGYCDLLAQAMSLDDHRRGILNEIMRAAEKSSTLTSQLLAFGRKQFLRPQQLDVNVVLNEMRGPLSHLIGEDVLVSVAASARPSVIFADRGMLEQAIINLAINARDAMMSGGSLRISTSNLTIHPGESHETPPGEYICVSVSDSGVGMNKESLMHIFDPFYTTKPVGRGTGMGMSMVYGFVKQSGGHISVNSSPDKGTTVLINLPLCEMSPDSRGIPTASVSPGAANIVVVEDNDAVRRLVVRILKDMKFNVLCASDGAEAIPIIEHFYGKLDVLVTDIVMPNMSGYELAKKVRRLQPECKVIFITGYSEVPGIDPEELATIGKLLNKPFTREALAGLIEEALGKK